MRLCAAIALLAIGAGCALDQGTGPAAMTISVRLRDDAGAAAGTNQIILTDAASTQANGRTRPDGTAEFKVARPGTYWVQVVPRAGYLSSSALRKEVTIAAPGNTVVEFTLYRDGTPPIEPTESPSAGGSAAPPP